jgi:hypothetical protein
MRGRHGGQAARLGTARVILPDGESGNLPVASFDADDTHTCVVSFPRQRCLTGCGILPRGRRREWWLVRAVAGFRLFELRERKTNILV